MSKWRNSGDAESTKSATPQAGKSRVLKASAWGFGIGLSIVALAVWLSPLPDNDAEIEISPTMEVAEATSPAAGEPSAARPTLEKGDLLLLPSQPEVVQVAELQAELRDVADQLTKQYPNDVASYHFAAQAYFELKQSEKAEELWRTCVARSPQHMGPYVGFATLLIDKGRNEEAVAVLLQAQQRGGSAPEMLEKLAEAYENLGDLPNALACLSLGTVEFPEVANLWLMLGRVQNQLGKASEAEVSLRQAIERGGDREAALLVLNAALIRQRKVTEAAANREELSKLKQAQGTQADTFQESYDLALRRIASEIFASAGTLAEAHDNLDEAKQLYLRSASLNPKNLDAYRGLLIVSRRQQRLMDQKSLLNRIIELQPQDVIAHTNLASVASQLGEPALAELTLKNAINLDPHGVLPQAAMVKLYLSTGNLEEARLLAAQVVERQPISASYRLLAATYRASGLEEAFVVANRKADELAEVGSRAPQAK